MNSGQVRKHKTIIAALVLFLVSMPAVAKEYMTPEYARAEYRPKAMVLIPPRAEVMKKKVASTEQLIEEGAVLEDVTASVLKEQLGKLGYEVRILSVEDVNADPELQAMVRSLNELYDEELPRIMKKGKDIRKRRFRFGDAARILAARLDAEAFVMCRIQASGATGGQMTMAILFGGSTGFAAMSIGIIAGDNGDLEAFFTATDTGMSPTQLSEQPLKTMTKVTSKVIKRYPAADETGKYRKAWPQSTDRKVAEAELSDEDVLSDLEALFENDAATTEEQTGAETPHVETGTDEAAEEIAEPID